MSIFYIGDSFIGIFSKINKIKNIQFYRVIFIIIQKNHSLHLCFKDYCFQMLAVTGANHGFVARTIWWTVIFTLGPGELAASRLFSLGLRKVQSLYMDQPATIEEHYSNNCQIPLELLERVIENWNFRMDHVTPSYCQHLKAIIFKA